MTPPSLPPFGADCTPRNGLRIHNFRFSAPTRTPIFVVCLCLMIPGCGSDTPTPPATADPAETAASDPTDANATNANANPQTKPASDRPPSLDLRVEEIIREETSNHQPIAKSEFDLISNLMMIAPLLDSRPDNPTRLLTGLTVEEEWEHYRTWIRRWEKIHEKSIDEHIKPLAKMVQDVHFDKSLPDDFESLAKDSLISVRLMELDDLRWRRNKAIHARVNNLIMSMPNLTKEEIADAKEMLNSPDYAKTTPPK